MFACIHATEKEEGNGASLKEIAGEFSPLFEVNDQETIVFSIDGLDHFYSSPHQIAEAINRRIHEARLSANIAIASTIDSALFAARNLPGKSILTRSNAQALAHLEIQNLPIEE